MTMKMTIRVYDMDANAGASVPSLLESFPDWKPCDQKGKPIPETFTVVFEQEKWFKSIVGSIDCAGISFDNLFFIFSSFLKA